MKKTANFDLPFRVVSRSNERTNRFAQHRRDLAERGQARTLTALQAKGLNPPYRITLTRIYPPASRRQVYPPGSRAFDGDNLQSSLKAIRDGIADGLGINDGDAIAAEWVYRQEKGGAYNVQVVIEEVCDAGD